MKLKLKINLAPLKEEALRRIDAEAETARSRYITLGSGQAMVYAQKEKEAELIAADPAISPALVPHLASEANAYGVGLLDQAIVVLTMAQLWRTVSPAIEVARLTHKDQASNAATPAEIENAVLSAKVAFDQTDPVVFLASAP